MRRKSSLITGLLLSEGRHVWPLGEIADKVDKGVRDGFKQLLALCFGGCVWLPHVSGGGPSMEAVEAFNLAAPAGIARPGAVLFHGVVGNLTELDQVGAQGQNERGFILAGMAQRRSAHIQRIGLHGLGGESPPAGEGEFGGIGAVVGRD